MTDPHDRPYTFGWHGEVVRREATAPLVVTNPTPPEYVIESGWLCESVNQHTCGTGPDGYYGAHEPGCGLVPIANIADLLAERDRATAERAWDEGWREGWADYNPDRPTPNPYRKADQ